MNPVYCSSCGVLWQCGRELVWAVGSQGSLLALAFCRATAAHAQVGGHIVCGVLEGDHDAVHQTSEGGDVVIIQILVGVEDGGAHHHDQQELEQHSQVAASSWRFAGRHCAAPSGQSLRVRVGLGVDDALEIVLVNPVVAGFQRSSGGTTDGAPAGGTGWHNRTKLLVRGRLKWLSKTSLVCSTALDTVVSQWKEVSTKILIYIYLSIFGVKK